MAVVVVDRGVLPGAADQASASQSGLLVPYRPEIVGSGFLPLLQSASIEPFSGWAAITLRRRFGRGSRADLDTAQAERGRDSLSGGRVLSGAWDLADSVYKVGSDETRRVQAGRGGPGLEFRPHATRSRERTPGAVRYERGIPSTPRRQEQTLLQAPPNMVRRLHGREHPSADAAPSERGGPRSPPHAWTALTKIRSPCRPCRPYHPCRRRAGRRPGPSSPAARPPSPPW
jgi:hypothetical protein